MRTYHKTHSHISCLRLEQQRVNLMKENGQLARGAFCFCQSNNQSVNCILYHNFYPGHSQGSTVHLRKHIEGHFMSTWLSLIKLCTTCGSINLILHQYFQCKFLFSHIPLLLNKCFLVPPPLHSILLHFCCVLFASHIELAL